MIYLALDTRIAARLPLSTAPVGIVALGSTAATVEFSARSLGALRLPVFPATVEEFGLMGVDGFLLGADGTILQGADA